MTTLREVVENPGLHSKLAKMKIATDDDCRFHFFALTDGLSSVLWSCDTTHGCQGLVTTDLDGELTSMVNAHSSYCRYFKKRDKKLAPAPKTVTCGSETMQEVLVEISSLSKSELKTGVLEASNKKRNLMPVTKYLKLPESIPKAYDNKTLETQKGIRASLLSVADRCRMCGLPKKFLTSIHKFDGSEVALKVKLEWLLNADCSNENDGLPNKLCSACVTNLNNCYNIYISAIKTQRKLQTLIEDKKKIHIELFPDEKFDNIQPEISLKADRFFCDLCPKGFFTKRKYNDHVYEQHLDELISKAGTPREMINHDLICKVCQEKMPSVMHLVKHYREAHFAFYCDRCKEFFADKKGMQEHTIEVHDQPASTCTECDELFYTKVTLENHQEMFHSNKPFLNCKVCQRLFISRGRLLDHLKLHIGKRDIICTICSKSFMSAGSLRNHMPTHNKAIQFECEHCSIKFSLKKYLIAHLKRHHITMWYYRCLECGIKKSSIEGISEHCAVNHEGTTEVMRLSHATCTECGEMLANTAFLIRHIKENHRDPLQATPKIQVSRTYTCPVCSKVMKSKSALRVHSECAHEIKKFKCTFCPNAEFTYEALLRQHEKTKHNISHDFTCSICNNKYDSHRKLAKHIDNTHGKNPSDLMCVYCDKVFACKSTLNKHLRTHKSMLEEKGEEAPQEVQFDLQPTEEMYQEEIQEMQVVEDDGIIIGQNFNELGDNVIEFINEPPEENVIRITLVGLEGLESRMEYISP